MTFTKIEPHEDKNHLKVLIADDDAPTRILLRTAISQWGYKIVEAKDGIEAWNILQQSDPPHLLILDWLMPNLDGIALCNRIKHELNSTTNFFIILLTQKSGATSITKSAEAGADEFLAKPFDMTDLKSRLAVGAKIIALNNQLLNYRLTLNNLKSNIIKLKDLADSKEEYKALGGEFDTLLSFIDNTNKSKQEV